MKISAQVVLINEDGLVLGVSRKDDFTSMGLPGGKMEPEDRESTILTAFRETFEETGIEISNLRLVLAMHNNGYMSYTYLADYKGEINHNEPHIVKWVPFETLLRGSFGDYNKLVLDSLIDMGIKVIEKPDLTDIKEKVSLIVEKYGYKFIDIDVCTNWLGSRCNEISFKHADGEPIDEDFYNFNMVSEIKKLGDANGVILSIPSDYYPK